MPCAVSSLIKQKLKSNLKNEGVFLVAKKQNLLLLFVSINYHSRKENVDQIIKRQLKMDMVGVDI